MRPESLGTETGRAGASARGTREPLRRDPDVHYGDARHWVAGDRGCSQWLLTGTNVEGARVEVRGCDLFGSRGEKIVRKDSYWKIVEG